MMEFSSFIIGEKRRIAFFESANDTMPSQEVKDTEQAEQRKESSDKNPEKSDEQMEDAMEQMKQRIAQGEQSREVEMNKLKSAEKFRKGIQSKNSFGKEINDALETASKDLGDTVEESADLTKAEADDISKDIGRKPAPNETTAPKNAEAQAELRPTEKGSDDVVARDEAAEEQKIEQTANAPSESPEGSKPR